MSSLRLGAISFAIVLSGCSSQMVHAPAASPVNASSYIDLETAWRLRVIIPITRSGKYDTATEVEQQNGLDITVRASSDFLGYETDYYAIRPHRRNGIRIEFESAEQNINGTITPEAVPHLRLFNLASSAKYVRLLYLRRESKTDHDMAVLAADKEQMLADLTERVESDPHNCTDERQAYCSWIPLGIAVRPEHLAGANGNESWAPVR